jgi:tRNA dimethylallyltransferase
MPINQLNQVLVIVGPTAVGKTELSIRLAKRFDAEIISADSRLVYKGMDIGTAKPSVEEKKQVPHHMIDLANPDEEWSLSLYQKEVARIIKEVLSGGKLPIVVGGTGQYIRSMIEGWVIPEVQPNLSMRGALEKWAVSIGPLELHRKLKIIDPIGANSIDPTNLRRTIRALEVIFTSGHLFSSAKERTDPAFDFKVIGLTRTRDELYKKVDDRIESMFKNGFVAEVEELITKGYPSSLPSTSAIGYAEVMKMLNGGLSLEEVKVLMKRRTRQFIRRQTNWFKPTDPIIEWFQMTPDPLDEIEDSVRIWLNKLEK